MSKDITKLCGATLLVIALLASSWASAAYSRKTTGLGASATTLIIVDDDDTTVVDLGSTVLAQPTVHANVTIQDMVWNGVTRKAFQTDNQGSFNFYGLTWGSGDEPSITFGDGASVFIAAALGPSNSSNSMTQGTSSDFIGLRRNGSNQIEIVQNVTTTRETSTQTFSATDFSERIAFGYYWDSFTDREMFLDVDGGTVSSLEIDTTDIGTGGNAALAGIGGWSGQGYQEIRILCYAVFNGTKLSVADYEALRDDWFGELIDAGGGTTQIRALQNLSGGFGPHESQELNGVIQHD